MFIKLKNGIIVSRSQDKTRARIMAYAEKIFYERGFRKITIEELCAAMSLSKRTFYKYFANRDELVTAVVAHHFGEIAPLLLANLNSRKPINQILETHFDLIGRELFTHISTPLMSDVQTLMPELWERIDFFRTHVIKVLIRLIRRGQNEGVIRKDIDAETLGKVLQGMVSSLAHPAFLSAQGLTMEQLGRLMNTLILHGILADNPQDDPRAEAEKARNNEENKQSPRKRGRKGRL
jgi:AcrR family transcriptional regulator